MKKLIILSWACIAVSCVRFTPATTPFAPAVDIVIKDQRSEQRDFSLFMPHSFDFRCWVPFVPYKTEFSRYYLKSAFTKTIRDAIIHSNYFAQVKGPGDTTRERADAPLEMQVHLIRSGGGKWQTTYCLGVFGYIFNMIGAPYEYAKASARIELIIIERGKGQIAKSTATGSHTRVALIYDQMGTNSGGNISEAVKEAILLALKGCRNKLQQKQLYQSK